ncbi:MAG TPA: hypothetical protein VFF06_16610 [Polyangia bacterium]|nr:hypothetical protein [Polyangia bacterium]
MLDPWIIEEIRRREEEERQHREQRPVLEVPLESPPYPGQSRKPDTDQDGERGVVIVDFCV